jgi:hypothetical protein
MPSPPLLPALPEADVATLQSQLANLRIELAGLQAQWSGLKSQLDNMLRTNPARPGVQQQWADVGVQKARVEGAIAVVQARLRAKEGLPPSTSSVGRPDPWANPAIVIPSVSIVSLFMLLPLSIGLARRIGRRAPMPAPVPAEVATRLERIEHAVDAIAIEVERISEGQRFVTKIMADRPASGAASSQPAVDNANQQRQPLALGAGEEPAQPIVVPERQRVRN